MADLRQLLSDLGYGEVRTHLQSGNVLLHSDLAAARLEEALTQQISSHFAVPVSVVVRTRAELADVGTRNPLREYASDPKRYQVSFLAGALSAERERELAAADLLPERLVLSGREIFSWHSEGIQRSRLAALLTDRRVGVTVTTRNWNTVTRLLELAGS